jgi:hypothetical protein
MSYAEVYSFRATAITTIKINTKLVRELVPQTMKYRQLLFLVVAVIVLNITTAFEDYHTEYYCCSNANCY